MRTVLLAVLFLVACQPAIEEQRPVASSTPTLTPFPTVIPPTSTPTPTPTLVPIPEPVFHKGVNILVYGKSPEGFKDKVQATLSRLKGLGVNSVSLVFPFYQRDSRASEVYVDQNTPSDETVTIFVRAAKNQGFWVTLRPLMDEKSLSVDGQWRGTIEPLDRGKWFKSYAEFLKSYAILAQREKVDVLSVGVEFLSLENETARWRGLIGEIRGIYSGKLIYSTDFVGSQAKFWDRVDYVGVDAFYEFPELQASASARDIEKAWGPKVASMQNQFGNYGKPMVVTELGTASQRGSFRYPWRLENVAIDLDAQMKYYGASCNAMKSKVNGIYWWMTNYYALSNPLVDSGFDFIGKPAEKEVSRCFS